eukprot:TRINITY_DN20255_c0_g1_i1.p1 TRINITY_DN20255_c0_g1~~TRINITY_DN20255_c0_g1_i1.p1  ORF type:complete len:258 (-),score=41.46 TRINITY_DN20255_c0_g1_i1:40-780(-)
MAATGTTVELDGAAQEQVLSFVNEARARTCCRAWDKFIVDSLNLSHAMEFGKLLTARSGKVRYHHSAVRTLGQDFEECVAYQFEFTASKMYSLQWNRSFGQWSAANEKQIGKWRVVGNVLRCESVTGPEVEDGCVRFAPAGRVFELPVSVVVSGNTLVDEVAPLWEYEVRGVPPPPVAITTPAREDTVATNSIDRLGMMRREDSRYVEIDGEVHEVAGDIQRNYPESEWGRLMSCRARFGLLGHTV